ncbi:MAG: stage II sporulation protein M [Pseudomonadota bacterium]
MTKTKTEMDSVLRSRRFRLEREADWLKLEDLLARVAKGGAAALTNDELVDLPRVYRSTLSALSVARSTSLDKNVIAYLESLSTRAYFFLYGSRASLSDRFMSFLRRDWPLSVRAIWRETVVALAITLLAGAAAFSLVMNDADWFYSFAPADLAGDRSPAASTESLRSTLYDGGGEGLSVFATFLFTHNARVAIFAFALGFAFCIPTVFLLAYNGCVLGAFLALFVSRNLGFELGGWLLIHGVTELFAIILAGAAGLKIGWAVANPGDQTRLAAVAAAGRTASLAVFGVIIMLFLAGLLEGFGRQLITNDLVRYAVALSTGVLWWLYFYGGRVAHEGGLHGEADTRL